MSEYTNLGMDALRESDMSNSMSFVPPPPKKGETMKCRDCAKDMPPESFPKSKTLRKVLFKWQLCEDCWDKVSSSLDMNTPGLITERYKRK